MLHLQHPALFAAFDVYPSAKGASTHIYHNADTLFKTLGGGWLNVMGSEKLKPYQQEENIEITRFQEEIPNYLQRAKAYSDFIFEEIQKQNELKICHFRDVWSAIPILYHQKNSQKNYKTIFEINGLYSIELPYHYPMISKETLEKIRNLEKIAAQEADYILCPSEVIKENIRTKLNIPAEKITVITNGADVPKTFRRPRNLPPNYIIYFGALQGWQGVEVLLKAFAYLHDYPDLKLVICASSRARQSKYYRKMSERLGISEKIVWLHQLRKRPLYNWVHFAQFSVAPLTECTRNLEQGCCPLKVLESMALGTPVIASDIPAVREIIKNDELGFLVRADRPAELARMMRVLLEKPESIKNVGMNGLNYIQENFTWTQKRMELKLFYTKILESL